MKAIRRKTTGTGRMRYLRHVAARFKSNFREGKFSEIDETDTLNIMFLMLSFSPYLQAQKQCQERGEQLQLHHKSKSFLINFQSWPSLFFFFFWNKSVFEQY